jgi:hypothetical protein
MTKRQKPDLDSITDITPNELAESQLKMLAGLNLEPWEPLDDVANSDLSHRLNTANRNKPCPLPAPPPSQ